MVRVGVGIGVGEGVLGKVGVGAGAADFEASSLQTTFLPDFTQVKVLPLKVWILPTFLHREPAFGGFTDHEVEIEPKTVTATSPVASHSLFITLC